MEGIVMLKYLVEVQISLEDDRLFYGNKLGFSLINNRLKLLLRILNL